MNVDPNDACKHSNFNTCPNGLEKASQWVQWVEEGGSIHSCGNDRHYFYYFGLWTFSS
jgi:hypothetical protein